MSKPTYIYVIGREGGPVKIGVSVQPHGRVIELQTGCPFPLKLFYAHPIATRAEAMQHEAMIHRVYEENRLVGEWFDICEEQGQEAIETTIDIDEHFKQRERGLA